MIPGYCSDCGGYTFVLMTYGGKAYCKECLKKMVVDDDA